MIKFIALCRDAAMNAVFEDQISLISIRCPYDSIPKFVSTYSDILFLEFDDIDKPFDEQLKYRDLDGSIKYRSLTLFSLDHAKQILEFVDRNLAKGISKFVIHCDAGISRSPGVVVALKEIYNGNKKIFPAHDLYNRLVYRNLILSKSEKS
jgi:predicted protein tyrosine phosphatase